MLRPGVRSPSSPPILAVIDGRPAALLLPRLNDYGRRVACHFFNYRGLAKFSVLSSKMSCEHEPPKYYAWNMKQLNRALLIIIAVSATTFSAGAQASKTNRDTDDRVTVLLDDHFNHETKKAASGQTIVWHYKWNETDNGGYSAWAEVWDRLGARTETLSAAPTASNLKTADIYIIVDPDTDKESSDPKYVQPQDVSIITDWVKKGGVLVLMGNDAGNAEFQHFNQLAGKFGIQFNEDSLNRVQGNNYADVKVIVEAGNAVFPNARTLYLKEISSLSLQPPAKALITENGKAIMATSRYGKGTVFAVGDPWLYNEYANGKLPAEYENLKAAQDLSRWLIDQTRKK